MVSGTTDAAGNVTLTLPSTGSYVVTIDKQPYNTGGGPITVNTNGQSFTFDLTQAVSQVQITIAVSGGAGTISVNSQSTTTSRTLTFNAGDSLLFSATPASGYKFDHFMTIDGSSLTQNPYGAIAQASGTIRVYFVTTGGGTVQITVHVEDSTTKAPIAGASVSVG